MKIRFRLNRPKADTYTSIQLNLNYVKRFKWGTGISINPKYWNPETDRPINSLTELKKIMGGDNSVLNEIEDVRERIDEIEHFIRDYDKRTRLNNQVFDFQELRTLLNAKFKSIKSDETLPSDKRAFQYVSNYTDHFIDGMETGERRTPDKERKYAPGTIKNYKQFHSFWDELEKAKRQRFRFSDIDLNFHKNLITYCNKKGYRYNYTGRIIKQLKSIIKYAYKEGIHENEIFRSEDFKVLRTEVDEVYLTEKEVRAIYELDLSKEPRTELLRDVFLIGCYTALRFSDFSRISRENIKRDEENGPSYIDIITKKTGEQIIVPIRPELEAILKKYEYRVPKVYEQKMNAEIKDIAQRAGISGTIEKKEIIGGSEVIKNIPRYELIKTHTARRTAATLMYLAGIPAIDIMKITGHKTEKSFMKYIRTTKQETATRLINNAFFRGNPLKVSK
ncbi:site-specific integrase [Membranihabitans maritimus]|uniref:site-specific integrase n=1 Tax=Membranihabitans maritimus TaxID=2904244 RepID=UPI001F48B8FE|nr:site-specific integrase [Membranihabitans maritimus]